MKCKHCCRPMASDRTQRHCEKCIADGAERSLKTYYARKDAGLCGRCGGVVEAERAGRVLCRECNTANSEYERNKQPILRAQRRRRRRLKRVKVAMMRMREARS